MERTGWGPAPRVAGAEVRHRQGWTGRDALPLSAGPLQPAGAIHPLPRPATRVQGVLVVVVRRRAALEWSDGGQDGFVQLCTRGLVELCAEAFAQLCVEGLVHLCIEGLVQLRNGGLCSSAPP